MGKESCQVVLCGNERSPTTTLHLIPSNQLAADRWKCFLKIANEKFPSWQPIKRMSICSCHFKENDFRHGYSGRKMVVADKFPSLYNGMDLSDRILVEVPDPPKPIPCFEQVDFDYCTTCQQLRRENEANSAIIQSQDTRIQKLENEVTKLKQELQTIKRGQLRTLAQRCKRQADQIESKNENIRVLQNNVKKIKLGMKIQEPTTSADELMRDMIARDDLPKNHPFTDLLKEFAFNLHYISPKGYDFARNTFDKRLPDKRSCSRWISHVNAKPGLLDVALNHVKSSNESGLIFYGFAFDEVAIRQQILWDGEQMVGKCDYGSIANSTQLPDGMAKSALFCLATEINGSKSFPIAYILTNGLKATVMADFVKRCIVEVRQRGGCVLSISCDGLASNFSALKLLGANFEVESPSFNPSIKTELENGIIANHVVIPDVAHMMKLARNTLGSSKVLFNGDGNRICWSYVVRLVELQEREKLRAGNKLTSRHVNYDKKIMNVKLSVQVLSSSTADAIQFCNMIGAEGFGDCEATVEFFRINDEVFDLLNTLPFGKGKREPLSVYNKLRWTSVISSAKQYYLQLGIVVENEIVPLHQTNKGTFVKGLISALVSLEALLGKIETHEITLKYLPTFRIGQDPLENFFATLRRRLGSNDNPNVLQLQYCIRAMLSFKLSICTTGNCDPQENLQDKLPAQALIQKPEIEQETANTEYDLETDAFLEYILPQYSTLSLFVENVSVYISGFVGYKLLKLLECEHCKKALFTGDSEYMSLRQDYFLVSTKDRGGLCKPSEDLTIVCKIVERAIRQCEAEGVMRMKNKRIEIMVKNECADRNLFDNLHNSYSSSAFRKAKIITEISHKWALILEICKVYIKTRLNFIASTETLKAKRTSNRNYLKHITNFKGL